MKIKYVICCSAIALSMVCSISACGSKQVEQPKETKKVEQEVKEEPETEESTEESTSEETGVTDGIRDDFKSMMDDCESVMNQYCDFMEKYNNAEPTDLIGMAADYAKMTKKYADMSAKVEKVDESELSSEELVYYTEVMGRVNVRLAEVAGQ